MDYRNKNIADFASDQYFIEWVLKPTAEHKTFWEEWLKSNPEKLAIIQEARELVLQLAHDEDEILDWELDAIWENLQESQRSHNLKTGERSINPFRRIKAFPMLRVAAVVVILLLSGIAWFQLTSSATTEYITNYGERRTIQLPDHSTVILNANSKIEIPSEWSDINDRKVKLTGEAYFMVSHNNNQKFLVETHDGVTVEVLGTEFNVSDRGDKNQVVLASGKVRLYIEKNQQQLYMNPGDLVEISEAHHEISKRVVNTEFYTSWKDNRIIFDNTSLKEVAWMLEQNYGYPVIFQDQELANLKITASLEKVKLETILTTLSETLEIDILKKENQIIVKNNPPTK